MTSKIVKDTGGGCSICGQKMTPPQNIEGTYWLCAECLANKLAACENRVKDLTERMVRIAERAEQAEAERDDERKTSATLSGELTHLKESILAMGLPRETMLKIYETRALEAEAALSSERATHERVIGSWKREEAEWDKERAELKARAEKAEAELLRYDLAIQSLTPGGSEFVHDPERCVETMLGLRRGEHDALIRAKAANADLALRLEQMRGALNEAYQLIYPLTQDVEKVDELWSDAAQDWCKEQRALSASPGELAREVKEAIRYAHGQLGHNRSDCEGDCQRCSVLSRLDALLAKMGGEG
jgi:hypothetical protein